MHMFAETFGNKQGTYSRKGVPKKTISTYEHGGVVGNRLLDVREVTRFDAHAHKEAVRCAIRHLYDVNLGIKDLAITVTGRKLSDQHYGWIAVITRRTTRTRA